MTCIDLMMWLGSKACTCIIIVELKNIVIAHVTDHGVIAMIRQIIPPKSPIILFFYSQVLSPLFFER